MATLTAQQYKQIRMQIAQFLEEHDIRKLEYHTADAHASYIMEIIDEVLKGD
jgi:hypothetical protein